MIINCIRSLINLKNIRLRVCNSGYLVYLSVQFSRSVVFNYYHYYFHHLKNKPDGLPWWSRLRICLPVQGTWVLSLVQEDPTWCRATTPALCS